MSRSAQARTTAAPALRHSVAASARPERCPPGDETRKRGRSDRTRPCCRPSQPRDQGAVTAVAGLCLIGLPIVLSASGPGAIMAGGSPWSYEIRQCMYMTIGVAAALICGPRSNALVRKLRVRAASCRFRAADRRIRARNRSVLRRLQPLGRDRSDPDPALRADETRRRRVCRRLVGSTGETVGSVERRRSSFARVHGLGGRADHQAADLGTAIVIGCITFSMLFAAGVRLPTLVASAVTVFAIGAFLRCRPPTGATACCPSSIPSPTPRPPATKLCSRLPPSGSVG